jgi:hypothetical protein
MVPRHCGTVFRIDPAYSSMSWSEVDDDGCSARPGAMNPISADQTDQNSDADGDRKHKRRLRPGNVTQPTIVPIGRLHSMQKPRLGKPGLRSARRGDHSAFRCLAVKSTPEQGQRDQLLPVGRPNKLAISCSRLSYSALPSFAGASGRAGFASAGRAARGGAGGAGGDGAGGVGASASALGSGDGVARAATDGAAASRASAVLGLRNAASSRCAISARF